MIPPRRLSFQLIPLLDLLLIVVFAQYLEGRIASEQQAHELTASRDLVAAQLDEALRQILALREQLNLLEEKAATADARGAELTRVVAQRDLIGEMVGEMFRVPQATLDQLLAQRAAGSPGPSPADVAELKRRLQALAGSRGDQIIDHLLTFGELRKRCDIWELYLQENGTHVLTVGDRRQQFRVESAEAFAGRLFDAYKTLPEPKSMVLILATYGDARFKSVKATLDGLPAALERIRSDAGGRSRFEYAVLGYRPAAPQD